MTKYFILRAYSDSEWDPVSFALLPFDMETVERLIQQINLLEKLRKKDPNIYFFGGYDINVDFFNKEDDLPDPSILNRPSLIQFSEETFDKLSRPEQRIATGEFKISIGSVQFKGYGKHSSDHFWTDDLSLADLEPFVTLFHLRKKKLCSEAEYEQMLNMTASSDPETRNLLTELIKAKNV